MTVQRFNRESAPVTPWKNGGGTTCEIASWPPTAGIDAFDWRVSIATIAASGPFSVFTGVDRTIMLLQGDGMRLQAQGIEHRLDQPNLPFAFSGDLPLDCTLLGGASSDFNVMSRRQRGRAEVRVLSGAVTLDAAPAGLLMSLRGNWQAGDQPIAEGEGLWWADDALGWSIEPADAGALIVVMRWTASTPLQAKSACNTRPTAQPAATTP